MALLDTSLFDTRLFDDTSEGPGTPGRWSIVITSAGNWTAALETGTLLESAPQTSTR